MIGNSCYTIFLAVDFLIYLGLTDDDDDDDGDDDDELLLRNGWVTQGISPYFQPGLLLATLTVIEWAYAVVITTAMQRNLCICHIAYLSIFVLGIYDSSKVPSQHLHSSFILFGML